jgi:hypothetical protein
MRNLVRSTAIISATAVLVGIGFLHLSYAIDDYEPGDLVVIFSAEDTPMIDV